MKKTVLFRIFLFVFVLFPVIWINAQKSVSDVKVTQSNYFIPILEKISLPARNPDLLLSLTLERKRPALKVLSSAGDFFSTFPEKSFPFSPRLENRLTFPFRAYFVLAEKIKTTVLSDVISMSDKPVKVVDGKKKVRVVLVFRTAEIEAQDDVESYAVVHLDKNRVGVTEQKLLSQPKTFEFETTYEKHLLGLEVYVQDPFKKAWKRLRNIEQPGAKYFIPDPEKEVLYILVTYTPANKTDKYQFESGYKQ